MSDSVLKKMSKPACTVILDERCDELREAVEAFAPLFVFKRSAGFLSSPLEAAEELSAALAAAGCAPPYVYAAASFAGFTALAYADRFPENLAGLVLVDSSHPEQSSRAVAAIPADELVTPAVAAFKQYLLGFGPVWTESCAAILKLRDIGDIPLIVLAAGKPDMPAELSPAARDELTASWHALQRQHASRSTRGDLRVVPGVGHALVRQAPDTVVAAIRELVERRAISRAI